VAGGLPPGRPSPLFSRCPRGARLKAARVPPGPRRAGGRAAAADGRCCVSPAGVGGMVAAGSAAPPPARTLSLSLSLSLSRFTPLSPVVVQALHVRAKFVRAGRLAGFEAGGFEREEGAKLRVRKVCVCGLVESWRSHARAIPPPHSEGGRPADTTTLPRCGQAGAHGVCGARTLHSRRCVSPVSRHVQLTGPPRTQSPHRPPPGRPPGSCPSSCTR
jgi:hypothetical protein